MIDVYSWLDILSMLLETFSVITETLLSPIGEWLPARIAELPLGDALAALVNAFFSVSGVGDFSLITLMFGAGLSLFVVYTMVTWVLNVVT